MLERPNADALMQGPLGGWLRQQTHVREEARSKANSRLFMVLIIGLPVLVFMVLLDPLGLDFKFFLVMAGTGLGWWWSQAPKREAIKQVKIGINDAIADTLGLEYTIEVDQLDGFHTARAHEMFPGFTRASFEDQWCGQAMGHRFCLHDAHLEERRGSGKNRRWVTTFRGAVMTIGCTREVHGVTLVQRSGKHRKFFGGAKDTIRLDGRELAYVDMVHPGFEDVFDIYSTDQVEARYLVHPAYVERLLKLEQGLQGQDIRALFVRGELIVVMKANSLFESGSIEASQDRVLLERTIEQFGRLADLAASLNEWDRAARKRHREELVGLQQDRRDTAQFVAGATAAAAVAGAIPARPGGFGRKGLGGDPRSETDPQD
ncbi:DUF3137 domain-containing protein [Qipengyuania sp. JC766]|uniref:DUF3137 domain-containing protein n=1 Tax=Qipengyuania sp. JC766 TaxID=3232139 RepID=UPI003457D5BA